MTPDDKYFYQQLGKRIATHRKARGLTQTELAEQLGISQQTMAHYEGGRLRVALSLMPSLMAILEAGFDELMGDESTSPQPQKRGPASQLERQIVQVRELPRAKQKFVMEMIDTVIQQAAN